MSELIKYYPTENIAEIRKSLDEAFSNFFSPGFWRLPVDIDEEGEEIRVSMDIPGMQEEDIHIEFEKGVLHVSGERKSRSNKEGLQERSFGHFERRVSLPDAEAEEPWAEYENGVLTVHFKKRETSKGEIKIRKSN